MLKVFRLVMTHHLVTERLINFIVPACLYL